MTRFGSRSAQSFKPPAPSAVSSSQRPALPPPTFDTVPDDSQPRVPRHRRQRAPPSPLLYLQTWRRHRRQPRLHHPCLVICVQTQALRPQRSLIDLSIRSRPRNANRPSRNSWLELRCPRYASYPCSTDRWIPRRVYSLQTSQPCASASGRMRVCARIPYQSAPSPSLNTIINSFSSCSLLAPCAHVWDMLHTRPPMTFLEATYAISKPRPLHNLSRTHALAYSRRVHPTLSAGRDPWVLPHL